MITAIVYGYSLSAKIRANHWFYKLVESETGLSTACFGSALVAKEDIGSSFVVW